MTLIAAAKTDACHLAILGTGTAGVERLSGKVAEAVGAGGVGETSEDGIAVRLQRLLLLQDIQHRHSVLQLPLPLHYRLSLRRSGHRLRWCWWWFVSLPSVHPEISAIVGDIERKQPVVSGQRILFCFLLLCSTAVLLLMLAMNA